MEERRELEDRACEFGFCLEKEMACTLPLGALTG